MAGWRLESHESIGSTSDTCIARARAGEPDGLAVLAARQTQGRGSRGRDWDSPTGNLHLSVLLRPPESARTVAQWALLAGVALAEAISGEGVARKITLKWPNDVLLGGKKLAGILLDSATDAGGKVAWLVIGMGANLATAPEIPGRATTALADHDLPPAPNQLAEEILARLDHWRQIRGRDGFAPVRAAWLARAQPIGTELSIKLTGRTLAGEFAGLGEDGSLLLRTGGEVRAFATGEVLLPDLHENPGRG
jgi:BirA family biotin operon repressor/biotin-[acetyl-CoA-carboxylase] ligase